MTYMSSFQENAIRPPFDQFGWMPDLKSLLSEPSTFITYISQYPARFESNTMRRPSPDQFASRASAKDLLPEPSALTMCTALMSPFFEWKAMRRPSGDQSGS